MNRITTHHSLSNHKHPIIPAELPFGLNDRSVAEWIDGLPIGNKVETCKTVFGALQGINSQDLDIPTRFQILERFRRIAYLESAYLASRLIGSRFPLERKSRKIAKLAAKFHTELASGYQTIADHIDFEETCSTNQKACVLHRMVSSIGMSLLRIAQLYESPSSKAWITLKKIYLEAESKRLLDTPIQDPIDPNSGETTISQALGSIVLFTVCNPNRYSQADIENLYRFFTVRGAHIEWMETSPDHYPHNVGIDLKDALIPRHGSTVSKFQSRFFKEIDTNKFLAGIGETGMAHARQSSGINETSLETVLHHLGKPEKTRIRNVGRKAELTIGLDNVVAILRNEDSKPSIKKTEQTADWLTTTNFELLPLGDEKSENRNASRPDRYRSSEGPNPYSGIGIESGKIHCEIHSSELPNHLFVEMNCDSLTIGQLVGLKEVGSSMQIGVTRWMQSDVVNRYAYYGIEQLSPKCSLANVFIASRKFADVLLLEKDPRGMSGYSILMPVEKFPGGTRLTVRQPGMTKNFVIEKLVESAPFFCHYSLATMHTSE